MGSNQLAKTKNNRSPRLRLRFWGVRGSIPTPQAENLHYGGNTACLEVCYRDQQPLGFDAGSGVRQLGLNRMREFARHQSVSLFLTHFHWDHIQGLPFFWPLYQPDMDVALHSAMAPARLEQILEKQMAPPLLSGPLERCPSAEALYPGEKPGVYPRRRYGCAALPAPSSGRCGRLPHRGSGPVYRVRHRSRTW